MKALSLVGAVFFVFVASDAWAAKTVKGTLHGNGYQALWDVVTEATAKVDVAEEGVDLEAGLEVFPPGFLGEVEPSPEVIVSYKGATLYEEKESSQRLSNLLGGLQRALQNALTQELREQYGQGVPASVQVWERSRFFAKTVSFDHEKKQAVVEFSFPIPK